MGSAQFSYLQLLMDINPPRWSHCPRQFKTRGGHCSSSLESSGYMNRKIGNKWQQQNTDSYFSYLELVMDVGTQKGSHCTRQLETKRTSDLRSSGHRNSKTESPETNPGKIPSLLDIVIPIGHNVSPNLNTCKRQFKQKQRKGNTVSSKHEKENKETEAFKVTTGQITLLCDSETPRSNADTLTQNPSAKDLTLTCTDVHAQKIDDATCTAVRQLKDSLTSEDRNTIVANTDENVTLSSGTVTIEQGALCEQDRQYFSAADTLMNDGNVPEQYAAMSLESSGVNNDHSGNGNTEMVPLQQSHMLHGLALRKSRMARFLGPIPFRSWMYIVDTNNHHDNTINNGCSFQQWGDLQHDTHNDGSLPDSRRVSESIDGPVTPEAFSSKNEKFIWNWPPAPVPKSQTEAAGEDDTGTLLDPLPALEMTGSEFVEMIEGTYKEPVIEGTEENVNVQKNVPSRIHTDNYWMSLATDQITRPCCKTESLLMDVTRQLVGGCLQVQTIDQFCSWHLRHVFTKINLYPHQDHFTV